MNAVLFLEPVGITGRADAGRSNNIVRPPLLKNSVPYNCSRGGVQRHFINSDLIVVIVDYVTNLFHQQAAVLGVQDLYFEYAELHPGAEFRQDRGEFGSAVVVGDIVYDERAGHRSPPGHRNVDRIVDQSLGKMHGLFLDALTVGHGFAGEGVHNSGE